MGGGDRSDREDEEPGGGEALKETFPQGGETTGFNLTSKTSSFNYIM